MEISRESDEKLRNQTETGTDQHSSTERMGFGDVHSDQSKASHKSEVVQEDDIENEHRLVCGFVHELLNRDAVVIDKAPTEIFDIILRYYLEMKQWEREENERRRQMKENLRIQEQIQRAIALFQEEFGAELEDQLRNIEEFQYESSPSPEHSQN